ncbi:MAG: hypothetical protein ACKPKO_46485, partial [Candidatus Fonsibacter sp.]
EPVAEPVKHKRVRKTKEANEDKVNKQTVDKVQDLEEQIAKIMQALRDAKAAKKLEIIKSLIA